MSEKSKMIAGQPHFPMDEELTNDRNACKDLCFKLNHTLPSDTEAIQAILQQIFQKDELTGTVTPPFFCDYGYNITFGEIFFANYNCVILDSAPVTFGDRVFIGPDCGFYTATHPIDAKERGKGVELAKPITVGSDVWFGGGVHVMPGVTIGDDVVIGAGSIVTKDIPSHVVAVGNPCKVIRHL